MKMRLLVLTSLISTAGLVDSAMAMNGKVDEKPIEHKNFTIKCFTVSDVKSRVDNNFEKKGHEIDLNTLIHNLTKNKFDKLREYLEYRKNKDIAHLHNELNTDDFTSIFRHCNHPKHITRLLTKNEATTVRNYIQNWLTTYFTLKKIAKAANFFEIELTYIKNLHIRRIFAHELVKHLRSIIIDSTAGTVASQFTGIKEGLAKWAIRFIYNEVMTRRNTPLIDNMDVVSQINDAIAYAQEQWINTQKSGGLVCTLNLSHLNNRQQLENFLLHAHEILEPLLGCNIIKLYLLNNDLRQVPNFNLPNLQWLSLYNNQLTQVHDFNLPNLQWLDLTNNLLNKKPVFSHLPNNCGKSY